MSITYSKQSTLPKLPVPMLEDTKTKLLEAIEPVVSESEFQQTTRVVDDFFKDGGDAQKLQQKLVEWDRNLPGSWLKPFWDDLYLNFRGPLHTGSNFNIMVDTEAFKEQYSVAELAAKVSRSVAELYVAVMREEVKPETVRNIPLDMSQYPNFFRSIRIPKIGRDEYRVAEFSDNSTHVCLLYRGNVYKISVTDDQQRQATSEELASVIASIFSTEQLVGPNVGVLTTDERDHAAKIYEQLLVSKINEENLQAIADALVVISIDEESKTSEEALKNLMASSTNKWFDKTFQIVLSTTGDIGYSVEHTAMDGTTSFAVIQYIQEQLLKNEREEKQTTETPIVEKLAWELSDEVTAELAKLERMNIETVADYVTDVRTFDAFGTDEMKRLKFSPDSFFHMALQVAQYRTFGHMRSTYESVSMRTFNEGRTECLRPSSAENLAVAKAMAEVERDSTEIHRLMQEASVSHSVRMKAAQQGLGVERHLYGLQKIFERYNEELEIDQLHPMFTDPGYAALRYDFISTSNMTSPLVKSCIFGPVVEDGYGIFYVLLADRVILNVSSYTHNEEKAKLLADHFVQALKELREVVGQAEVVEM